MIPSFILKRKDLECTLSDSRERVSIGTDKSRLLKIQVGYTYLRIISFSKVSFDVKTFKSNWNKRKSICLNLL